MSGLWFAHRSAAAIRAYISLQRFSAWKNEERLCGTKCCDILHNFLNITGSRFLTHFLFRRAGRVWEEPILLSLPPDTPFYHDRFSIFERHLETALLNMPKPLWENFFYFLNLYPLPQSIQHEVKRTLYSFKKAKEMTNYKMFCGTLIVKLWNPLKSFQPWSKWESSKLPRSGVHLAFLEEKQDEQRRWKNVFLMCVLEALIKTHLL